MYDGVSDFFHFFSGVKSIYMWGSPLPSWITNSYPFTLPNLEW